MQETNVNKTGKQPPETPQRIKGSDVLLSFAWFVALPGLAFYIIGELINRKVIPEKWDGIIVPLMIALAVGTLMGFIKFIIFVFRFFNQPKS